jgi:hypothetical protein
VKYRRAFVALGMIAVLPFTMASKCDLGSPKPPKDRNMQIVEIKRQPGGKNGKMEPGEVTCWQLQLKIVNPGGGIKARNTICVEKGTWDTYKVGDLFPK